MGEISKTTLAAENCQRDKTSILKKLEYQIKDERSHPGDASLSLTPRGPDRSIHERRASHRSQPYATPFRPLISSGGTAPQPGAVSDLLVSFDPTSEPSSSRAVIEPLLIEDPLVFKEPLTIEIMFAIAVATLGKTPNVEVDLRARVVKGEIGVARLFEKLFDHLKEENGVRVSSINVHETEGPSYLNEMKFRLKLGGNEKFVFAPFRDRVRNVVEGLGAICVTR